MQFLMQLALLFFLCFLGEAIHALLPFAFPSSVISLLLLFAVLYFRILKVYHLKQQSDFLLNNMAFLFIPATVSIAENFHFLQNNLLAIIFICFASLITTFALTAYTVQLVIKLQNKKKHISH